MKIEGAIFDFDGTLVNSMFIWENLASDFLISMGLSVESEAEKFADCMTLEDMALVFQMEYGVTLSVEEIISIIRKRILECYQSEVTPKEDVIDFLEFLSKRQVKMCIATLSEEPVVRMILKKYSMEHYFTDIFTTEKVGKGKNDPDIYYAALECLGTKKEETLVFEDAYFAAKTAHEAGFTIAAVYDPSERQQEKLKEISTYYFHMYDSLEKLLKE